VKVKQELPYISWSHEQSTIRQSKVVDVFAELLGHIFPAVTIVGLLHLSNVCCEIRIKVQLLTQTETLSPYYYFTVCKKKKNPTPNKMVI
jgi:hypothetical protein